MGVIFKARDRFLGSILALKILAPELVSDPEILKRFYLEAQSARALQHPNIVTIYDVGEADGLPYIAMEFVEGETLQNIINRRARIPLAVKLKLVQQICEGLGHAHKHGFVHRDVKPAHTLVTNDGTVKVVGFGIVPLETANLTKTGMFLGTIHYAPPEQFNDGRFDSRSDIWSVTCVVYELIAYKKAFDGSNTAAIIGKVLATDPEPLSRCCPGVPTDLDAVISKGLKRDADERYQSLDEMLKDLLPVARSIQQPFIAELVREAKDLREKGDFTGALMKLRAVLILDNSHGEAKRLSGEIAQLLRNFAAARPSSTAIN
jgi:serine/threonine-protein kinase